MARDSAVPRSDVLDKTELLIVLPTGLVAQGQNRLFLAGFDFARCLLWFQPVIRSHSCQGVSFLASTLCLEVLGWFQLLPTKQGLVVRPGPDVSPDLRQSFLFLITHS